MTRTPEEQAAIDKQIADTVRAEIAKNLPAFRKRLISLENEVESTKESIASLELALECGDSHRWENARSGMDLGWETCKRCGYVYVY